MKDLINEIFDNCLDLGNCEYSDKELENDIKTAMRDVAIEYHKREVEKLNLPSVSNCYCCKKEYTSIDKEHGMCHKCWSPIIEE